MILKYIYINYYSMNKKIVLLLSLLVLIILAVIGFFLGNKNGWSSREVVLSPEELSSVLSESNQAQSINCLESSNGEIKKDFIIKLTDINDPTKYRIKRQEAVSLINQCYELQLVEEYEVMPGEISSQVGNFKNKISQNTRVFDKLSFYPGLELLDYSSVALYGGLTYSYAGNFDDLLNFYKDAVVEEYRMTPTPEVNELVWTDIATTQNLLTIKFSHFSENMTLVTFDFIEPLATDQSALLLGRWRSLDDVKSEIEFSGGKMISYYQGEKLAADSFVIEEEKNYLVVNMDDEKIEYNILELSDTKLSLVYLSRGNILLYEKVK